MDVSEEQRRNEEQRLSEGQEPHREAQQERTQQGSAPKRGRKRGSTQSTEQLQELLQRAKALAVEPFVMGDGALGRRPRVSWEELSDGAEKAAAQGKRDPQLPTLGEVAQGLGVTQLRARRLLITAGYFTSPMTERVREFLQEERSVQEIARELSLTPTAVYGYIPYRCPWLESTSGGKESGAAAGQAASCSAGAADAETPGQESMWSVDREGDRREAQDQKSEQGRARREEQQKDPQRAIALLRDAVAQGDWSDALWSCVRCFEESTFRTLGRGGKGSVEFTYSLKSGRRGKPTEEIKFSRKEKTITRATVDLGFARYLELLREEGQVKGPKKLGIFGASYLLPLFLRFYPQ